MQMLLSQKQDTPKGSSDSGGGAQQYDELEIEMIEDFSPDMRQNSTPGDTPTKTIPNNMTAKSMIKGRSPLPNSQQRKI